MKFRSGIVIAGGWCGFLLAQPPVLTLDHFPRPGIVVPGLVDTMPVIADWQALENPESSPTTWSFPSSFQGNEQGELRYLDPAQTGFDTSAIVASSDYAIQQDTTRMYLFVRIVNTPGFAGHVTTAVAGTFNGRNFLLPATDPDTIAVEGLTYMSLLEDDGLYEMALDTTMFGMPDTIFLYVEIYHRDTIDAYGTFVLPAKTLTVLRVRRFSTLLIHMWEKLFNYRDTFVHRISYETHFIADDTSYKAAVVSYSVSYTLTNPPDTTYQAIVHPDLLITGVEEDNRNFPFAGTKILIEGNHLTIQGSDPMIVEVYTYTGNRLVSRYTSEMRFSLPAMGMYIVRLADPVSGASWTYPVLVVTPGF